MVLCGAGLLVMENRLKVQTTPVIRELKLAAIRPVMITGTQYPAHSSSCQRTLASSRDV